MAIKINYLNKTTAEPSANLILFSNEKFNTNSLKKFLTSIIYFLKLKLIAINSAMYKALDDFLTI